MKSYEGQTFMTQVISKRVYALVAGPRTPKKERCADGHRQGSRLPSPVHGGISEAVDEPCGLSANLQVLRLASTAGSLHKHISTAPGGFVSNIWIVVKCRGAVLWRALQVVVRPNYVPPVLCCSLASNQTPDSIPVGPRAKVQRNGSGGV